MNIPSSLPQEALTSPICSAAKQSVPLPVSSAPASDVYATLTTASVLADTYDKQDLNNIFDTLLLQKWPAGAFPEANAEVSMSLEFMSKSSFCYTAKFVVLIHL